MTKLKRLIRALGGSWVLACMPLDLSELVQNAGAYESECVCVTGVTEGDGVNFVVFLPPSRQQKREILVDNKSEPETRFRPLDGHWYRLCGVVTVDERGLFPCKLALQSAHVVNRPSIPGRRIFGTFRNEGPNTIRIDMIDKEGQAGNMILDVGGFQTIAINEIKEIRIFAVSEDLSAGKLVSSRAIPDPKSASRYFDKSARTFYFSIKNGNTTLVEPRKARMMKAFESSRAK